MPDRELELTEVPARPSDLGIDTLDGKDQWREGQRDTIAQIVEAFRTSRFVLCNAPPGSGKTILGTAVQRILDMKSVVCTHTKGLQAQYTRTLPWATVVTGRNNHGCELLPEGMLTSDQAPCSSGEYCEYMRPDGCSYYKMLFQAKDNPQVVLNYAYATRILQSRKIRPFEDNPFRRELLVCDEGDLAEDAIVDAAGIYFADKTWERFEAPLRSTNLEEWAEWRVSISDALWREVDAAKRACSREDDEPVTAKQYKARAKAIRMRTDAERIVDDDNRWLIQRDRLGARLRPLWGRTVARGILWQPFNRILLMSATLGDPKVLMTKLDIDPAEATYIDVPSTFPAINRPVMYWPVVRLNKDSGDDDWDRLASAIEFIGNQDRLREQKALIHTNSFAVARALGERLPNRYRAHNPADDRNEVIETFAKVDHPQVLISPSFGTGVDLPYMIGWQVIAKVMFGDLGDPITRMRRETVIDGVPFGKVNYDVETMNRVVQACGRAVRAPDDQGICYILDANFWPLYKRVHSPAFFKEAFHWLRR